MGARALVRRRLAAIDSHLAPRPARTLAASGETRRADASRGASPPLLLDDAAMRQFLVDGFVLVQPDLPAEWHAATTARAAEIIAAQPADEAQQRRRSAVSPTGAAVNQAALWAALTPELTRVTECGAVRGALTSILGNDYFCGGGGHMHEAAQLDQYYHRDGSVRGVREHAARGVILMYYPAGCTLEMGSTAIVRGSQYLTVDRDRWPQSEDRLDVGEAPPQGTDDDTARAHWQKLDAEAARAPRITDAAARDAAMAAPIERLGLAAAQAQLKVVVPPGGFLIMNRECHHRGTRPANANASW